MPVARLLKKAQKACISYISFVFSDVTTLPSHLPRHLAKGWTEDVECQHEHRGADIAK